MPPGADTAHDPWNGDLVLVAIALLATVLYRRHRNTACRAPEPPAAPPIRHGVTVGGHPRTMPPAVPADATPLPVALSLPTTKGPARL